MKKQGDRKAIPLVALRGVVVFPKGVVNLDVARPKSIAAIQKAINDDKRVFLVAQSCNDALVPCESDLYNVGTVCEIKQFHKYSETEFKLTVVGDYKAKIVEFISEKDMLYASLKRMSERLKLEEDGRAQATVRAIKRKFVQYGLNLKGANKDFLLLIENEKDPFKLFTVLAGVLPFKVSVKQNMLEESILLKKLMMLLEALAQEVDIVAIERKILEKVESKIDKNQRNYFLREQAEAIQEELESLDPSEAGGERSEYIDKISKIKNMSDESREKLLREVKQLEILPNLSNEAYVITNHLDIVLSLPWDVERHEALSFEMASSQLDKDHYGLKKVKDKILENLAVRSFNANLKGRILCLVGPPGVGKTSISRSIAKVLGKNFVKVSLGGINDESDIRGHKKTYVGAMPGKIVNGLIKAKSRNPLILLDEIDKMGNSFKGDPAAALLEVLDSEQNCFFTDHYIEIPFDISGCFFVATANSVASIPLPLLNRMEIIELNSYTCEEKFHIAREHIWPKLITEFGLTNIGIEITDDAINEIIECYTKEAGVRELKRVFETLLGKAAKKLLLSELKSVTFSKKSIVSYLGSKKYLGKLISSVDEVGVVNGLAWTSIGGELMQIEAGIMDGKGKVQLTGNLGDVMKESANTAISFVRSIAPKYHIASDFHKNKDIHIHVPEGAVPKDGPSAGMALATALVSALSNVPVRRDIAMTGEISLRGRDLAIGGLKEKAIAAYKSGVTTVLIPKDNLRDLEEIDDFVKDAIEFIPCTTADQVLEHALLKGNFKKDKVSLKKSSSSAN